MLYAAGALDDKADEDFGVAVYGRYDGWGNGLGKGLVCDLEVLGWVVSLGDDHENEIG